LFGLPLKILLCTALGIGLIPLQPLHAQGEDKPLFRLRAKTSRTFRPQARKYFYADEWNRGIIVRRYKGKIARAAAQTDVPNPLALAVDVRTPYHVPAETSKSAKWCAPGHWTPWDGDWAFDIWCDNGEDGVGANPNATCDQDVYLRVSASTLPGGTVPDRVTARTFNPSLHVFACASQDFDDGGYQQAFEIYATYAGQEIALGWVLYAHLDNVVYSNDEGEPEEGLWISDPMNVKIGTVFNGDNTSGCWGGCHIHMEFYNYDLDTLACYQNVCQSLPETDIPVLGDGSIVGKLGGDLDSLQSCPVYDDDEKLPCATWDMDLVGCDAHGGNPFWKPPGGDPNVYDDTQDCAYYTDTSRCAARGT
jgi:hypothetical protein